MEAKNEQQMSLKRSVVNLRRKTHRLACGSSQDKANFPSMHDAMEE